MPLPCTRGWRRFSTRRETMPAPSRNSMRPPVLLLTCPSSSCCPRRVWSKAEISPVPRLRCVNISHSTRTTRALPACWLMCRRRQKGGCRRARCSAQRRLSQGDFEGVPTPAAQVGSAGAAPSAGTAGGRTALDQAHTNRETTAQGLASETPEGRITGRNEDASGAARQVFDNPAPPQSSGIKPAVDLRNVGKAPNCLPSSGATWSHPPDG